MSDLIDRQQAIDALWKALYEYEDKTEKQFIDSEELDVADWIQHRNFVQNMSDIDRQTILSLPSAPPETNCSEIPNNSDLISRKAAIDAADRADYTGLAVEDVKKVTDEVVKELKQLPSAQPERDTPRKPTETTDRTWGIPHRQAVCPNCDRYLDTIHFICEGDKRKVSYCESCGQAIDWKGWEQDETD